MPVVLEKHIPDIIKMRCWKMSLAVYYVAVAIETLLLC